MKAFVKYADLAEEFLQEAAEERPYDTNHKYQHKMSAAGKFAIAAGAGLITTVIVMLVLLGQLRTVRAKGGAKDYVRSGSFRVTEAKDIFLYRTVSRQKIEHESASSGGGSTTRSSSGGGRSGGRGGSF